MAVPTGNFNQRVFPWICQDFPATKTTGEKKIIKKKSPRRGGKEEMCRREKKFLCCWNCFPGQAVTSEGGISEGGSLGGGI